MKVFHFKTASQDNFNLSKFVANDVHCSTEAVTPFEPYTSAVQNQVTCFLVTRWNIIREFNSSGGKLPSLSGRFSTVFMVTK